MKSIGNKEIFIKNLRYYIDRSGKMQIEIADAIGVSKTTFNSWVRGQAYPRIDKIEKLAEYFRISKSDLIEEHEPGGERLGLSPGEKALLEAFRAVPAEKQKLVLQMIRVAVEDLD